MAPKKKKVINHPAPNAHFPFNISKRKDESFQVPPGKRAKDNSRKYLVIPDSENSSLTEKSNPSSTESGDSSPAAVDDSSSAENSYTPSAKSDNNDDEYNRQIDTPSSSFTTFQSDNDEPDSEFNTGSAIMVEFESNIIIDSDSESDTGSVIIVDSTPLVKSRVDAQHHKRTSMSYTGSVVNIEARPTLPVSVETELNTQNRNLDELIHKIPPEIHQNIARFLPSDKDVARYSQVCKKTYSSISDSVWRMRFIQKFDNVPGLDPTELKIKYQYRSSTTKVFTSFDPNNYRRDGRLAIQQQEQNQKMILDMIRNLLIESDARKFLDDNGDEVIIGWNLDYIRDYVSFVPGTKGNMVDLMDCIGKTNNDWSSNTICSVSNSSNTLVLLIQLCLTWLSLDPRYCKTTISHFDSSQLEVYAPPNRQPIFLGPWKNDLNVRWCLHAANFFKFHLKAEKGEGLLAHAYADLHPSQLPQPWLGKLKSGTQKLGSHWRGAYFYVDVNVLERMRQSGDTDDGPYSDVGGDSFQDISLFFDEEKFGKRHWPKLWERILQSDPFSYAAPELIRSRGSRRSTRSSKDSKKPIQLPDPGVKYFYGSSHDSYKTAHFFGAVHGIPPQHGIPGFQRITIIKFFPEEDGSFDRDQSWGYEGCVLPGGRIIIGRWFHANSDLNDEDIMSGPFIFWNVDKSEAFIDGEQALSFFNLMRTNGYC